MEPEKYAIYVSRETFEKFKASCCDNEPDNFASAVCSSALEWMSLQIESDKLGKKISDFRKRNGNSDD